MANVLTTASLVECGHAPGKVTTTSTAKLSVSQKPVLIPASIADKSVGGCSTVTNAQSGNKQCLTVTGVTAGQATKLTVGGQPVMLDTLNGATDGTVGGTPQLALKATAGQIKLTAT